MRRRAFLAGLAAAAPAHGFALQADDETSALSGDRFIQGGEECALADILAPPFYHLTADPPPHFDASRRMLAALLTQEIVVEDVMPPTRWGVRRVRASSADGALSLQEALVSQGAARVAPESDDHAYIQNLLARENDARQARRGLWALRAYRVFDAQSADAAIGGYHLIEGVVVRAEKYGSRFYLNFDEDFRTDFTAGAASRLQRLWAKDGLDLADLSGARLRVRGFVDRINGPSVDLKHPLQIERL